MHYVSDVLWVRVFLCLSYILLKLYHILPEIKTYFAHEKSSQSSVEMWSGRKIILRKSFQNLVQEKKKSKFVSLDSASQTLSTLFCKIAQAYSGWWECSPTSIFSCQLNLVYWWATQTNKCDIKPCSIHGLCQIAKYFHQM